ncbi:MAG: DUF4347 domain-containing protein [Nitrospirales bacterium]
MGCDIIRSFLVGLCHSGSANTSPKTTRAAGTTTIREKIKAQCRKMSRSKKKDTPKPSTRVAQSNALGTLLALEPRIMFDGAALATGAEVLQTPASQDQTEIPEINGDTTIDSSHADTSDSNALWSSGLSLSAPSNRNEIIFIDTRVEDYQTLLHGIDPDAEAVLLDSTRDGIEQIAEVLAGRSDIDAIHLIAEGNQAELHLGSTFLTQETISGRYANLFTQIGTSLSSDADLLIYGCNFGQGDAGFGAMQTLAELTGADIAASTDRTGHVSEYANWQLEVATGFIETSVVIGEATQEAWEGVLATFTVTNTNDAGAGSLRQAIIDANAAPGTDTIVIPTGTYVLTTGKLLIDDDVIVTGAGADTTIIDGNANERIFETQGSITVTMSGLTIQNGREISNGAGVYVNGNSILNLSDATVSNNNGTGGDGGAFHVHGTLNLNRVLIANNLADEGAGIHFHAANGGTLTNVTFSGNTAVNQGGGVLTDTPITVINSTFTLNNANDAGGIYTNGALVQISNTIVSGNTAATANDDVLGSFSSSGYNLIEVVGGATGFVGSDITGVSANLAVLADNGGPTDTHALLAGSLALNAGTTSGAPAVDQRGITRDAAPDIGAYEYKSTAFVSKNEFTVNDPSGNNEVTSGPFRGAERAVDIAPNGDYVMVWTDETSSNKVLAKVLDASGNQKVAQFQVNIGGGSNEWADVAMDDSGNFVVTWTQGNDVFMRRFLANGTAVDAGDVRVNTVTSNTQQNPSVNMNGAGNFVIAWEGDGGGNEGIFVRQGSFGGGLVGSDIIVNTAASAKDPSVGIADSGNFVVVWDNGSDVFFQLYNSAGTAQTSGQVDVFLQLSAGGAAVDMSGDGRFTVAYRATVLDVDVYVRQFDAAGNPLFLPKTANTTKLLTTQTNPSITMDDIGEFIVVWEGAGNQPGHVDGAGVFGQKFNAGGQKIGFEFLINQTTANTQDRASVAMLDRDNFVAVWTGSDGAQTDIFARQFGSTASPTLDLDVNNSSGASGTDYAFTFTEGDSPTAIADTDTDLADADSTAFAFVTLSVSGLLDGNSEVLILDGDTFALATDAPGQDTTGGNYHVRVSTASGTATVSIIKQGGGTFSEAEVETLIKAIQYKHMDTNAPTDGDRLIEVRVNDGTTDSAAARTTINVDTANDQPVFGGLDNTPTFTEGGAAVVLDSTATITDPELDAANNYNGATLTLIRNGGTNAEDVFANSGTLNALTESGGLVVGGTTIGTVTTNSGGTLVLTFNGNATTALVNNALQQITYANNSNTPPVTVQIDFTINDGNAGAQGSGGALNGAGSITVTIMPTNNPPVAVADSFTVNEGSMNTLNLAGNDTDADDALDLTSITIVSGPTNGAITSVNVNGTVDYTHDGSETLTDSFTYTIRDLTGATSNTVTVSLTVTPVNDAPIIASNGGGANANISVLTGTTAVTDVDATDAESNLVTYSIIGGADAALFTIDPTTGILTFITAPDVQTPGDVGADNIYNVIVQASDGTAVDTQAMAVTVTDVPPVVIPPPPLPDPVPDPTPPPTNDNMDQEPDGDTVMEVIFPESSPGHFSNAHQGARTHTLKESDSLGQLRKNELADFELPSHIRGLDDVVSNMIESLKQSLTASTIKSEIQSLWPSSSGFLKDLDRVRDLLNGVTASEKSYMASSMAITTGLSVGYVIWLLRSGVLLTALLTSVPAWQFVNPLLILATPARKKGQTDTEDDSIETMFEQPSASAKSSKTTNIGEDKKPRSRWFRHPWR